MQLSVVIPIYNSASSLDSLIDRLTFTLPLLTNSYEIILVDDCSMDNSWNKIVETSKRNLHVKGYRLPKNNGQWYATLLGISRTSGQLIVTIDDDLEYPPEDIAILYRQIVSNPYQVVFGIAEYKYQLQGKNAFLRKSRNFLLNAFWNKLPTDSFKIFRRDLVFNGGTFLPTQHFEAYIKKHLDRKLWGYVTVNFSHRLAGKSNHTFGKKMQLFFTFSKHYFLNSNKVEIVEASEVTQ